MSKHGRVQWQTLFGVCAVVVLGACSSNAARTSPASVAPTSTQPPGTTAAASAAPTTPAAPTTTTVDPATARMQFSDALGARLGAGGSIDQQLALDLLATAYGHGADFGGVPMEGSNPSGTMALAAAFEHLAEFTPAQREAIEAIISGPDGTTASGPTPGSAGSFRRLDGPYDAMVRRALGEIQAHWPTPLGRDVVVHVATPAEAAGVTAEADTRPVDSAGNTIFDDPSRYVTCVIRVYPLLDTHAPADQYLTIAHEVFHCFQETFAWSAYVPWIIEGQAEWVGDTLAVPAPEASGYWPGWLDRGVKLSNRAYDATGFYASLARHGVDPWSIFPAMLGGDLRDTATEYSVATNGGGAHFMGEIAVDKAALFGVGGAWTPVGPGAPTSWPTTTASLAEGSTLNLSPTVYTYDGQAGQLHVADPVVTITSDAAPWAYGTSGQATIIDAPGTSTLCMLAACACPDGTTLDIGSMGASELLAVTVANATDAIVTAHLTITGMSLDTACRTLPRTGLSCLVGSWQLTDQEFGTDFLPGITAANLSGGIGGRHLDVAADGAYVLTDDGSDPVRGSADVGGVTETLVVQISGRVDGAVTASSGATATFESSSASVDIGLTVTLPGVAPIVQNQHYDDASLFGNGPATVECTATKLVLGFANVTFTFAPG